MWEWLWLLYLITQRIFASHCCSSELMVWKSWFTKGCNSGSTELEVETVTDHSGHVLWGLIPGVLKLAWLRHDTSWWIVLFVSKFLKNFRVVCTSLLSLFILTERWFIPRDLLYTCPHSPKNKQNQTWLLGLVFRQQINGTATKFEWVKTLCLLICTKNSCTLKPPPSYVYCIEIQIWIERAQWMLK